MAGRNAVESVKLTNLKVIVENKRGYNCGSIAFMLDVDIRFLPFIKR